MKTMKKLFALVLTMVMLMAVSFLAVQFDTCGSINDFLRRKTVMEKILQSGTGDHDHLTAFQKFHLIDAQGVVVEAGDRLCDQTVHGQTGVRTEHGCELPHR